MGRKIIFKEQDYPSGSGGGGSTIDYSTTEEIVVGTWFDGRPIYQKVWDNLSFSLPSSTWANTVTIPNGIDVVDIKMWGAFGNEYFLITPAQSHINSSDGILEVFANTTSTRTVLRMMVQYTKPTD